VDIHAPGIDTARLTAELQQRADERRRQGAYSDALVARAELPNLANMKNDREFMAYYLDCLREAVDVDINDFEIRERRARFGPLLVRLKRTIWNLLKFYTYRLWSQQNDVNGLLLSAVETLDDQYRRRIEALEQQVRALQAAAAAAGDDDAPGDRA
jgi:hypothetical protein